MDYNKLEIARQKFQDGQKLCGYSPDTLWLAVIDLFDALLEPPAADGSIDRATDGRITAEPGWKEGDSYFGAGTPNSLGASARKVAAIMADGCDPDPADDGPEVGILRGRVK